MNPQTFSGKPADLDFSMVIPEGFAQPPLPEGIADSVNLDSPTESLPHALIASQFAAAFIAVGPATLKAAEEVKSRICEIIGVSTDSPVPRI